MKALLIASLFLATTSLAQAKGSCVAYDSLYQPLCSRQPVKEACNARTNICKWLEMDTYSTLTEEEAAAEFELN